MSNLFIHGGWPTLLSRLVDGSDLTTDEGLSLIHISEPTRPY